MSTRGHTHTTHPRAQTSTHPTTYTHSYARTRTFSNPYTNSTHTRLLPALGVTITASFTLCAHLLLFSFLSVHSVCNCFPLLSVHSVCNCFSVHSVCNCVFTSPASAPPPHHHHGHHHHHHGHRGRGGKYTHARVRV